MGLETGHDLEKIAREREREMKKRGKVPTFITGAIITTAVFLVAGWSWQSMPDTSDLHIGHLAVEKAYYDEVSNLLVEVDGEIIRLLSPTPGESRLQRFLIRMANGQVVQVNHLNDMKEMVPLKKNDKVRVRGEYSWTETGGTIHDTERDFTLARRHGWIEHKGKKYQ